MSMPPKHPLPPANFYLGKIEGEWPLEMMMTEAAALTWYREKLQVLSPHDRKKIRLWRVTKVEANFMEYVPPSNPSLKVVSS